MPKFDKFNTLKKDFLDKYGSEVITKRKAARSVNRTPQTIWNWQQDDSKFDEAVEKAQGKQEDLRVEAVKDSLFERIIKGEAAASETIFWLINKSNGEFKDKHQINQNVNGEVKHSGEIDTGLDIEIHKAREYESDDELDNAFDASRSVE